MKAPISLWLCAALAFAAGAAGAQPDPFASPRGERLTVEVKKGIRVAYDVKDDEMDAGIGKALYYVRGLLESYKAQGVKPEDLKLSLVIHGKPAYWLLNEAAYQQYRNDPFAFNPNEHVVQALLDHGISVEICGSTMNSRGWVAQDLLPGVIIVRDAYTRLIDLQQRGYGYIRF